MAYSRHCSDTAQVAHSLDAAERRATGVSTVIAGSLPPSLWVIRRLSGHGPHARLETQSEYGCQHPVRDILTALLARTGGILRK